MPRPRLKGLRVEQTRTRTVIDCAMNGPPPCGSKPALETMSKLDPYECYCYCSFFFLIQLIDPIPCAFESNGSAAKAKAMSIRTF